MNDRVLHLWMRLISSAFISSVSVFKRHFFNNAKFCSAAIVSLGFALITMGFDGGVGWPLVIRKLIFNTCE